MAFGKLCKHTVHPADLRIQEIMGITFKKYFQQHPSFHFSEGVFWQHYYQENIEFTHTYLRLRKNEGRLFDDQTVFLLPETPPDILLRKEWIIRRCSADRLIEYLEQKQIEKIVELGCGNGWLINYMSKSLKLDFCGVDINKVELEQAARLFTVNEKISLVYADINSDSFKDFKADVFILAGAAQYFSDLYELLNRLLSLLEPGGEIHILDSPFYNDKTFEDAKTRGDKHFDKEGLPLMKQYYFYQKWQSLKSFQHQVLYNPDSRINAVKLLLITDSPFPWIKITKA